jgi:hypothetical protein
MMDPAKAKSSPMGSVILRALGFEERFEVETQAVDIQPGDVALLCTDGLSGEVSDADLGAILNSGAPARRMVETLVDAALQSGGKRQRELCGRAPNGVSCALAPGRMKSSIVRLRSSWRTTRSSPTPRLDHGRPARHRCTSRDFDGATCGRCKQRRRTRRGWR